MEEGLIYLFECVIYHEDLLNVCRQTLREIIPYEAFDYIARYRKGYITKGELRTFYASNESTIKDKYVELLIQGMRRRVYRKITLEAFCENLNPLEMGYYENYQNSLDEHNKIRY